MGKRTDKKTAKGRLDKFYKLAKEQGYRARSAFKLIQLNKRYQFLESARCTIDLCAAPGGWLQVAAKWMPQNSVILGVDLVPIKPIPHVVTATEDITTESCRRWLRSELKDWKADVVLHDGAPNVGTAWIQDAFTQAELVLHSLKLAVEMLAPNGTFVTKIFRSKDYTSLLYVFNQLFRTVEATKPPSSRNVSAEIFVVCQGFLAPKKVDPRLLDPAHVFKEVSAATDGGDGDGDDGGKLTPSAQNVFHPEKKRRAREGYDEGDLTLFKAVPVMDLVTARDPVKVLSRASRFDFETEEDKKLAKMKATTAEVRTIMGDLKVLGKGDFKRLLKWRTAIREELGLDVKVKPVAEETEHAVVEPIDEDVQMEEELSRLNEEASAQRKRDRRRVNEKRTRDLQRMQLQMTTPMDIGLERTDDAVFALQEADGHDIGSESSAQEEDDEPVVARTGGGEQDDEEEEDLSDEERRIRELEGGLDDAYDRHQEAVLDRDAKRKAREAARRKRHADEGDEEWGGIGDEKNEEEDDDGSGDDIDAATRKRTVTFADEQADDGDSDSDGDDVTKEAERIVAARRRAASKPDDAPAAPKLLTTLERPGPKDAGRATDRWFDQPVFKDLGMDTLMANGAEEEDEDEEEEEEEEEEEAEEEEEEEGANGHLVDGMTDGTDEEEGSDDSFDIVPQEPDEAEEWGEKDSDIDAKNEQTVKEKGLLTAEAMQLAMDLVNRRKTKDQLIDEGFHRDTFADKDGLPAWFLDDEMRNFRKHVPVTKEAVQALRDRMRALNARPIKKIAEAKGRKKLRALRRMDKMQNQANAVNEAGDMTEREKAGAIEKMLNKAMKNPKKRNEVKVVVAKGVNKGNKGRPRGVKGRYKMVDPRGKKELRAEKRKERATKSKRR